jgi:hypothetical protein
VVWQAGAAVLVETIRRSEPGSSVGRGEVRMAFLLGRLLRASQGPVPIALNPSRPASTA